MRLDREQVDRYFEDGFLIVENLLSTEDVQPVIDDIAAIVDELARRLHAAGRIRDLYLDHGFGTRLAALEAECPGAAIWVTHLGQLRPGLRALWSSPKLLDIIEDLIGPDIAGHPIWNIRSKTPRTTLMTVPWHQDTAYLKPGAERTEQPVAWVPLTDVTERNGALQVIRGGHRTGSVIPHHLHRKVSDSRSSFLYIEEDDLPAGEAVTLEVGFGSVIFLNQLIPHRSLENHSDAVRWSVDFRYQHPELPTGQEGVVDPIVMRVDGRPDFEPDWETWLAAYGRQHDTYRGKSKLDEFDPAYEGDWLKRWE